MTIIKKYSQYIALATALGALFSCETDDVQRVATKNILVMSDEFNAEGAPNPSLWTFDIGTGVNGWGNNELQYYTNREKNVKVENGYLLITADREDFEGASYTSARLRTQGLFEQQYGRFEARIRLPYGKGMWPAFWLLGNDCDTNIWPNCGEIDIMEYVGDEPTVVFGSVHGPGYSAGNAVSKKYELTNGRFDTEFHVFGIEWSPNQINYYVDDVLYNQITPESEDLNGEWVFNKPFYIIINLAVGGQLPGAPDENTVFPQTMLVDYVRVYQ